MPTPRSRRTRATARLCGPFFTLFCCYHCRFDIGVASPCASHGGWPSNSPGVSFSDGYIHIHIFLLLDHESVYTTVTFRFHCVGWWPAWLFKGESSTCNCQPLLGKRDDTTRFHSRSTRHLFDRAACARGGIFQGACQKISNETKSQGDGVHLLVAQKIVASAPSSSSLPPATAAAAAPLNAFFPKVKPTHTPRPNLSSFSLTFATFFCFSCTSAYFAISSAFVKSS